MERGQNHFAHKQPEYDSLVFTDKEKESFNVEEPVEETVDVIEQPNEEFFSLYLDKNNQLLSMLFDKMKDLPSKADIEKVATLKDEEPPTEEPINPVVKDKYQLDKHDYMFGVGNTQSFGDYLKSF